MEACFPGLAWPPVKYRSELGTLPLPAGQARNSLGQRGQGTGLDPSEEHCRAISTAPTVRPPPIVNEKRSGQALRHRGVVFSTSVFESLWGVGRGWLRSAAESAPLLPSEQTLKYQGLLGRENEATRTQRAMGCGLVWPCAQPVAILRVEVKDEGACTGHAQTGSRLGCLGHDLVSGSKGDGLCTPLCNVGLGLGHWPPFKGS